MNANNNLNYTRRVSRNSPKCFFKPVPHNSKEKYECKYPLFSSWCVSKKITKLSEQCSNSLYFAEQSKVIKSNSLWSAYSMLIIAAVQRKRKH